MGFFSRIKQSMNNAAAASRERAAQRVEVEEARARETNERNEREKGYGKRERADEYWAIVDRNNGLSGELPDIKFSKVFSALNDNDLENKLNEHLDRAVEETKRFSRPLPTKSTYFDIKQRFPNKEIFKVDSEAIQDLLGLQDDEFHKRRFRGRYGNGPREHGSHRREHRPDPTVLQPTGYFAIIEQKGATFHGEVPGFTMMRAVGSKTMDECVQNLTQQLTNSLNLPNHQGGPLNELMTNLQNCT